ncbi:uroporphyrinogen-III C-methyltransferase [Pleionea litopenaei]|uniref:Uroporphyrinogen-III C-methyltransferase n=1 Tax=Pleionea litopenaei TaxID=3070815 RepID=A0AA51RR45_9GAMM|nr:uroporphyrinogen-III C-methyltransferase [Pleionea sp. HL-JVS1]WMS86133.1 uroporphyrinogen-III C-methyltransferase [Pleionea sp. HL-JVS1]
MSDTPKDQEENSIESSALNESSESTGHIEKRTNTRFSWGIGLVGLLLLLSCGLSSWVYYQYYLGQQTFTSTVSNLQGQLEQQKQNLQQREQLAQQLNKQINQLGKQLSQQESANGLLRQQIVATQDKLRLLTSQGKQEWVLEQVHYYLRLAQEKLYFEHNRDVAIALLMQAEATLKDEGDLQLTPLRQAISNDLLTLDALPSFDSSSVLIRLNSMSDAITSLTTSAPQFKNVADLPNVENKAWYDRFVATMSKITEDAIKIRTHDDKVQPMLTKEQKAILQATIQLALAQAQTAVLENNNEYYLSRLTFSESIIHQYFKIDDASQSILNQLSELKKVSFDNSIELNLTSRQLIEEIKEQRRMQWLSEQQNPKESGDSQ